MRSWQSKLEIQPDLHKHRGFGAMSMPLHQGVAVASNVKNIDASDAPQYYRFCTHKPESMWLRQHDSYTESKVLIQFSPYT